mgnify:CR=1
MSLLLLASILSLFVAGATFLASWVLKTRSYSDREKCSPFECGFDPKNTARIPFSLRFFLLGIIFIVFDIEIVLVIPLPLLSITNYLPSSFITASIFILILILGLIHE